MTALQMEANKLRETERSNLAKEAETERSNRAKEYETHRSNLEQERKIDSEIMKNKGYAAEKLTKAHVNVTQAGKNMQDMYYRPRSESREDIKAISGAASSIGKLLI